MENNLVSNCFGGGVPGREAFTRNVSGAMVQVQWFGTLTGGFASFCMFMVVVPEDSPARDAHHCLSAINASASALIGQGGLVSVLTDPCIP